MRHSIFLMNPFYFAHFLKRITISLYLQTHNSFFLCKFVLNFIKYVQ